MTEDYAHARRLLATAVSQMHSERTLREGLFTACVDFLQWLDVDQDLPSAVVADYRKWCAGLLPDTDIDDVYDYVLAAIRKLDAQRIREKAQGLQYIAELLDPEIPPSVNGSPAQSIVSSLR